MPSIHYPGKSPGLPKSINRDSELGLENEVISYHFFLKSEKEEGLVIENRETGKRLELSSGFLPKIVFKDGQTLRIPLPFQGSHLSVQANELIINWVDPVSKLDISYVISLGDAQNSLIHSLKIRSVSEANITDIIFFDSTLDGAHQVGEVCGSVVFCEEIFLAVEHPLAKNTVDENGNVRCSIPQGNSLKAESEWSYSFVIGVTPENQERRGFSYYLDQRRAYPYRQFLNYNNWYDVWLGKPMNERMTESECLEAIDYFGKEFVQKRGVKFDAVVWDDGWDDYENSLWEFHDNFPNGFKNLIERAKPYHIKQGVWVSPNGGYAYAKEARLNSCRPLGYEINESGFSMAGPKYFDAYLQICLRMMREHGVVFFKFDSLGDGGQDTGKEVRMSDDVSATLKIIQKLRDEKQDVYISATAGTWASPFWLLYADNIWRQGGDTGHHGGGDSRQDWITYRDMYVYNSIVKAGPMFPLNSLMTMGPTIGNRPGRATGTMVLNERSVADEAWSFFGSGTCLQELYLSPNVPTDKMLDDIASAAKWARANEEVLVDTHWVGGSPEMAEVYGWASWKDGSGILVLRNPSDAHQVFPISIEEAMETGEDESGNYSLTTIYSSVENEIQPTLSSREEYRFELHPWEVLVLEMNVHPS